MTQEKLQARIDDLIKRGELTREHGKKLVADLLAKGQVEGQALSDKIGGEMARVMEKTPWVTRREYRRLEERVRALEAQLGVVAPDEVEPVSSCSDSPLRTSPASPEDAAL
jgi:polyhydroxyalkanoate synthesis regulator phasin